MFFPYTSISWRIRKGNGLRAGRKDLCGEHGLAIAGGTDTFSCSPEFSGGPGCFFFVVKDFFQEHMAGNTGGDKAGRDSGENPGRTKEKGEQVGKGNADYKHLFKREGRGDKGPFEDVQSVGGNKHHAVEAVEERNDPQIGDKSGHIHWIVIKKKSNRAGKNKDQCSKSQAPAN